MPQTERSSMHPFLRDLLPFPKTPPPPQTLTKLPDDILMNVLRHLKPLDIVAVRQTSRRLREPTMNKAVWMHALRVVIADNNVYPPTFPIAQMSVTELEHAASCPQMFTRILLRKRTSTLSPIPSPEPVHRRAVCIKNHGDSDVHATSMRLIAGGRFLVVETTASVFVMDLGWRMEAVGRREPIYILPKKTFGCTPMRQGRLQEIAWDHCTGAVRLFFALDPDMVSMSASEVVVYEITSLLHGPEGSVLAHLTLRPSNVFSVCQLHLAPPEGDHLALSAGNLTIVWDYRRNTLVSFPGPLTLFAFVHGTVFGLGSDYKTLQAYSVPPLSAPPISTPYTSVSAAAQINFTIVSPSFQLCLSDPPSDDYDHASCHLDDGLSAFESRSYDGQLVRYIVEKISPRASKARAVPFKTGDYQLHGFFDSSWTRLEFLPGLRVCDDGIVSGAMRICDENDHFDDTYPFSESGIYVHIANRGGSEARQEEQFSETRRLLHAEDPAWQEWDFYDVCPVSGRLCAMVGMYVCIFDYVPPSTTAD